MDRVESVDRVITSNTRYWPRVLFPCPGQTGSAPQLAGWGPRGRGRTAGPLTSGICHPPFGEWLSLVFSAYLERSPRRIVLPGLIRPPRAGAGRTCAPDRGVATRPAPALIRGELDLRQVDARLALMRGVIADPEPLVVPGQARVARVAPRGERQELLQLAHVGVEPAQRRPYLAVVEPHPGH